MKALYVIGEPGAGKSTLMRRWLGPGAPLEGLGLAATLHHNAIIQLGAPHDTFPGTDRLSMGVLPRALDLAASQPAPYLAAEGDRLATTRFLAPLAEIADLTVIWARCNPATAAQRRSARSTRTQNAAWVQGRITKTRNLADAVESIGVPLITIDTDNDPPPFPLPGWPMTDPHLDATL